jgi:anti-sigma factor RsiW
MREVTDDDRMMRRFLLDKLDLAARERIEEQFMMDDVFKEKLLMAEESLIEDYLDNSLDEADREKFNAVFSSSPEQREKLTIARAISARAKAEVAPGSPVAEATADDLVRPDQSAKAGQPAKNSVRTALLIAAAVVIVIFATLWLIHRGARTQESTAERNRWLGIQAELAELNSGSRSQSEVGSGETISLVLAPINTRGAGPPSLSRKRGVSAFEFWLLPTSLDHVNFRALIKKDGAAPQFEVSNLPLAEKPQGRAVRLRIPANLDAGAYQVELRAVGSNGELVYAGEYRFQIAE